MAMLDRYEPIVGRGVIDELYLLSDRLKNRSIQHINSTAVGGGVAEILNRMVPLLKEIGVNAKWDVIKGGEQFFDITKKIHNALHGRFEEITGDMWQYYLEVNKINAEKNNLTFSLLYAHPSAGMGSLFRSYQTLPYS